MVTREEVIAQAQERVYRAKLQREKYASIFDWEYIGKMVDKIFGYIINLDNLTNLPTGKNKDLITSYIILKKNPDKRILSFTLDGFTCKVKTSNYYGVPMHSFYIQRTHTIFGINNWKKVYDCEHFLKLVEKGII